MQKGLHIPNETYRQKQEPDTLSDSLNINPGLTKGCPSTLGGWRLPSLKRPQPDGCTKPYLHLQRSSTCTPLSDTTQKDQIRKQAGKSNMNSGDNAADIFSLIVDSQSWA